MINKIEIVDNSLESSILTFKNMECKRLNLLFGGNGTGKSTFLDAIKNRSVLFDLEEDYKILSYSNSIDNLIVSKERKGETNDDLVMILQGQSDSFSEGQTVFYWINNFIGEVIDRLDSGEKLIVCLDEIDSGLSSENINVLLHILIEILNDYDTIQFFISFNNYHFAYAIKHCFSMYAGEWIAINSYEEYFDLLNQGIKIMTDKGRKFNFLNYIK